MTETTGVKGFGRRLSQERRMKGVREQRDVEKQEVAKALGVSNSTYARWEAGLVPGDTAMEKLSAYFGVNPAWLHYGTGAREAEVFDDAELSTRQHEAPAPMAKYRGQIVAGTGAKKPVPKKATGTEGKRRK